MATASAITIDRYVVDTLMRDLVGHDRRGSAFLVYLAIHSASQNGRALLSHAQLAERTGLSKRACQDAVTLLRRRGLIDASRAGPTEPAQYQSLRPWARPVGPS